MSNGANLILQAVQPTIAAARPYSNFIQGQQDINTLQQQALNNQTLQQQLAQNAIMNPLESQLMQQRLAAGQLDLQNAQAMAPMQLQQAQQQQLMQGLTSIAREGLSMPQNQRLKHIKSRLSSVDFMGLDEQELMAELDTLKPEELTKVLENMVAQTQGQGLTEYQRRNLDLQEKRLSGKTSNQKDLEEYLRLKKTDPEAAKMFGQDAGLIPKDKELSATAEKSLTEATQAYYDLGKQAREYELLADDFSRFANELPSGSAATFTEFLKSVAGSQDEFTDLRRRLSKVRLSEALKYLPPGPATDRDVAEAFKAVPKENASPEQVQSFLRGAAKMAAIDAEFQEFKANYISENNSQAGLIPAWKEKIKSGDVESIKALTPVQETEEFDQSLLEFMTPEERALFSGSNR